MTCPLPESIPKPEKISEYVNAQTIGGFVLKCFRRAVVVLIVVALLPVGGEVAAADPVRLEDVPLSVDTIGCNESTPPPKHCLHLSVDLTGMTIESVPNMAATAFTREAFVNGTATETVTGETVDGETVTGETVDGEPVDGKRKFTVKSVEVDLGLQVGCQIDLKSGMNIGINNSNDFGLLNLNNVTGANDEAPSIDLSPGGALTPSLTVYLLPGSISDKDLITKKVPDSSDPSTTIGDINEPGTDKIILRGAIHDKEIHTDGCGGPVSVRWVATARVKTADSDENITAFGDIVQI